MTADLIQVKQLPVIAEQLREVKEAVRERTAKADALVCTAETLRDVKAARAALNKEYTAFENRRKEVKKAISAPYEAFEAVYKDCVSDSYKAADAVLKDKISRVENELRAQKTEVLRAWFRSLCEENGTGFLTLEKSGICVTLSARDEELKKALSDFLGRVKADLSVIENMDGCEAHLQNGDGIVQWDSTVAEEIRYEYEKTLSLAEAVSVVKERKAAIKREKSEKQSPSENSAQNRDQAHPGAVAANPTGGTPAEDDFFDELFASMECGNSTPTFEFPKKTYTLRFQLTDDEWRTLLSRINGLEYEVIRNED